MAFVHAKRSQCVIRDVNNTWRDITSFLNEVTVPSKAGVAETTVFGRGAKTYIGGLLEGTVTMKGFWDPTATTGIDPILSGLVGSQPTTGLTVVAAVTTQSNYGQFILFPAGSGSGVGVIADLVITDYNVSAPVTGVVAFTSTFQLSGAPVNAATGVVSLTYTTGTYQTNYAAATYGLQVVRAPSADILSTEWLAASGGAASFAALVGSTL